MESKKMCWHMLTADFPLTAMGASCVYMCGGGRTVEGHQWQCGSTERDINIVAK